MATPLWTRSDYWEYVSASLADSNCVLLLLQQKAKDGKQWASSQGGGNPRNNDNTGVNGKKKKKKRAAKRNKFMKKLIQKSVWNHEPPTRTREPASCRQKTYTKNVVKPETFSMWSTLSSDIFIIFKHIFVLLQCCSDSSNKTRIYTHFYSCLLFWFGWDKIS